MSILPFFSYLYPARMKEKSIKYLPVIDEEELPEKVLKRVEISYEKNGRDIRLSLYLVQSEEGLIALLPICTHLGCIVRWNDLKGEFLCPCHGGRYNSKGEVIGGPPPAPLTRLPVETRQGVVYIGLKS